MELGSDKSLTRLHRAVEWSRKQLAPFRKQRTRLLSLLTGPRYADNLQLSQPIPYLKLLYSVYIRSLVANNPRCLIATRAPNLKPVAHAMSLAINHQIKEMRLADTLRWTLADALVGLGIMKVGVCHHPKEGTTGLIHDYLRPYCDPISLDDWVHDMNARRFDHIGYCGHRFRVPREALLQDPRYNPDQIRELAAAERLTHDEFGNTLAHVLSGGNETGTEGDHEEMLDLWEFWIPRENIVVEFAGTSNGSVLFGEKPLRVEEYTGPELGPYHLLRFGDVPDNVMPSPPLMDMADLHEAQNAVYRKLIRQATRQKSQMYVPAGQERDAQAIMKAGDGEAVVMTGASPPQEGSVGSIHQPNLAFFMNLRDVGSYFAGNLDALAGLGPGADTLGQDKLLTESASKQIQGMQEQTLAFTRDVMECLAWYWWRDGQNYDVEVPVDGAPGLNVPTRITPAMREGEWVELNFQIDPYSLQADSPQTRLQGLQALLQNILLPAAPLMQQQGISINFQGLLRQMSRYMNMPDLDDILMFLQPQTDPELQEEPKMSANTTRTYERVSRSDPTRASRDNSQMMALLGGANQQQEAMQ